MLLLSIINESGEQADVLVDLESLAEDLQNPDPDVQTKASRLLASAVLDALDELS